MESHDPFTPSLWPGVTFTPPEIELLDPLPVVPMSPNPHSTRGVSGCAMCGGNVKIPEGPFRLAYPKSVQSLGSVEVWTFQYDGVWYAEEFLETVRAWTQRHGYRLRTMRASEFEEPYTLKQDMLRQCESDWFVFVDSDCYVHPDAPSIFEGITEPGMWGTLDGGLFVTSRNPVISHEIPERWNATKSPAWMFRIAGHRKERRLIELRNAGLIPDEIQQNATVAEIPDFGKGAVVWPYLSTAAEWDELRHSYRSVRKFWSEQGWTFVLIGDRKPDWWTDEFICLSRYEDALWVGVQCAEQVLWMNDDIFMLAPQSPETLSVAPEMGDMTARLGGTMVAQNSWRRGLGQVLMRLHHHGKPCRNFSSHTPYLYERRKAREILDRFGCFHKIPFETAYHNWYETPWKACTEKAKSPSDMEGRLWINPSFRQVTPEFTSKIGSLTDEFQGYCTENVEKY